MTTLRRNLAAAAALAMLIAACAGAAAPAASSGAPSSVSAAPSASAASPSAASASPSTSVEPSASAPASAEPSFDVSEILGSTKQLDSLVSYKMSMTMKQSAGTTSIELTTIRKPTISQKFDVKTAKGEHFVIVRIGQDGWVSQDGKTFTKAPASQLSLFTDSFTPEALLGSFQKQDVMKALTNVGDEDHNGVRATHYHIDDHTPLPATVTATVPPGLVGDMWVASEGYLVGMTISGLTPTASASTDVESLDLQVTNINDASLKVEPPK
jgi:hypothetical protein